ncbi:peptidoglycan-associated lipoprotein Pal [Geobacter sp.]|uniref:peptidoglycan-associated lipoprotein Pal n=1 Tax=Geobacter sp. TaxID=46610 RepID=UPI001ACBE137|nr:peptidoglycan-associated lipoprotein Pal [Geobacter sp.]CAG0954046.1 Peptidoglycan-associated lipoprotein [Geobacteraceae bacterium]
MRDIRTILLILCLFAFAVGCAKKEMIVTAPASGLGVEQGVTTATDAAPSAGDMRSEQISMTDMAEGSLSKLETAAVQASPLETVYFDFDSWLLTAPVREALVRNADWLRKNPDVAITVEGHTDERGSDAYNLALGEQRAKSTLKYLVNLGIDADRMEIVSYGEEQPAVGGNEESAWSKNRRVDFIRRH